jgi:hypothetical protein
MNTQLVADAVRNSSGGHESTVWDRLFGFLAHGAGNAKVQFGQRLDYGAHEMRSQGSISVGTHIGVALVVTLLMSSSVYLSPSDAQPVAPDKPKIVLDFRCTDDLTDDAVKSLPQIIALAQALSSQDLKGSTFVIACHVPASGGSGADQDLSERCADTVRRVLVEKFGLAANTLVAVGYGSAKPKNPANPASAENQRLEIVNMDTK